MARPVGPSVAKAELENLLQGVAKQLIHRVYGPEGMPWGPRTPQDLTERALAVAEAAAAYRPEALIVGCNTASVSCGRR